MLIAFMTGQDQRQQYREIDQRQLPVAFRDCATVSDMHGGDGDKGQKRKIK
jgi:hypothetical protein